VREAGSGNARPQAADPGLLADPLFALAARRVGTPLPRARPKSPPSAVNCPQLVARLGRSRPTAPPSGIGGGWTRWGAQVAGHTRRSVAMRQYARLKSRLPGDLVARGPVVVVRRFAARGRLPVHAVMFAAANRAEAQALCKRIAAALAPCVVVKNG
jgi:hypothetical protein